MRAWLTVHAPVSWDLERFARRHRQAFSQALSLELRSARCNSTFLHLFERVDPGGLFGLLRKWMPAQVADRGRDLDQLICDGKTPRGSASQPDGSEGATRFETQMTLDASELGVAIAQTSSDSGASHERAALKPQTSAQQKQLLGTLDPERVLIQADALHTSPSFSSSPPSRGPTCC